MLQNVSKFLGLLIKLKYCELHRILSQLSLETPLLVSYCE